jgi:hypothetical protein
MKNWLVVVAFMVVIVLGAGVNVWCTWHASNNVIRHVNELTTEGEQGLNQRLVATLNSRSQCFATVGMSLPVSFEGGDSVAAALGGQPQIASSGTRARMVTLPGEWKNIDNATRSLTQLNISRTGRTWTIQAWGRCQPADCDWGRVTLMVLGDSVTDNSPMYGFAHWDAGFKETQLTLRADGEELAVETYSCFKDNSGRANYRSVERFRR